jgi:hypothetical protein
MATFDKVKDCTLWMVKDHAKSTGNCVLENEVYSMLLSILVSCNILVVWVEPKIRVDSVAAFNVNWADPCRHMISIELFVSIHISCIG